MGLHRPHLPQQQGITGCRNRGQRCVLESLTQSGRKTRHAPECGGAPILRTNHGRESGGPLPELELQETARLFPHHYHEDVGHFLVKRCAGTSDTTDETMRGGHPHRPGGGCIGWVGGHEGPSRPDIRRSRIA